MVKGERQVIAYPLKLTLLPLFLLLLSSTLSSTFSCYILFVFTPSSTFITLLLLLQSDTLFYLTTHNPSLSLLLPHILTLSSLFILPHSLIVPFDFEVVVPLSVAANGVPVPVLQYGHGLFGDHGEVEESYLASFAQAHGYVLAATDWM